MTVQTTHQPDQLLYIPVRIIYSAHQTILKSQSAASLFIVIPAGFQYFAQFIFICNRHKLFSLLLCCCMKGQSQSNLKLFFRQIIDSRHNATSGYRNISLADIQPVFVTEHTDKLHNIIIIVHRFPCAHQHQIGYPLSTVFLNLIDLIQNLPCLKISGQSTQGRCTETASHPASYLGRHTYRISMLIFHQHTFNHIAILKPKQVLLRSINSRSKHINHLQIAAGIGFFQPLFQLCRNISHLIRCTDQLFMKPLIDLFSTKRLFSHRRHLIQHFLITQ